METFTELKDFVSNPQFREQRNKKLKSITKVVIDEPIIHTIHSINNYPHCFTLQSCFGHFVQGGNQNEYSLGPLSIKGVSDTIEYRIAYIALCIENNKLGKELFRVLEDIQKIDPANIQFCCADWFWTRQVNSFVLQVEPTRFQHKDRVRFEFREAQTLEKVRNRVFKNLREIFEKI